MQLSERLSKQNDEQLVLAPTILDETRGRSAENGNGQETDELTAERGLGRVALQQGDIVPLH